jgi:hypothetical protein
MAMAGFGKHFVCSVLILCFATQLLWASSTPAKTEEKFASLQIGSNTYEGVTVMTKAREYIYITHSKGMTSIKVSALPADIREQLGYAKPAASKWQPIAPQAWAKQAATQMDRPEVKRVEAALQQAWNSVHLTSSKATPALMIGTVTVLVIAYLFFCHCCRLICQKTGKEPGPLVWLPLLKLLPMLQAASMSRRWFILFLIPVLNLVGYVAWCFRIVHARGKTVPLAILLLLPVTNVFAFLYLAFSEAPAGKMQGERLEILGLQTA